MWLLVPLYGQSPTVIAGLTSGRLAATRTSVHLSAYGIGGGVAITGVLHETAGSEPADRRFRGAVELMRRATHLGTLMVGPAGINGALGRTPVVAGRLSSTPRSYLAPTH
jgi:hypothetical protein